MTYRDEQQGDEIGWSAPSANTDVPFAANISNNTTAAATMTAMSSDILPHLVPPTEDEATMYYSAFPSTPRLLGRTSAGIRPWSLRILHPGPFTTYQHLVMSPIGQHPILHIWDNVEPHIVSAISALPWTSVDVWRIGNNDLQPQERPVVVWVGIPRHQAENVHWDIIAHVLRSCRAVLDAAGLPDVEVELRTSDVIQLLADNNSGTGSDSAPEVLDPAKQVDFPDVMKPFTTAIGQPIFPMERDTMTGTLCVFLQPTKRAAGGDDTTRQLWALSCRHVVFPNVLYRENLHYDATSFSAASGRKAIASPRQHDVEAAMDSLASLAEFSNKFLTTDTQHTTQTSLLREQLNLAAATKLQQRLRPFENSAARVIGKVLLSPPIGVGGSDGDGRRQQPWTRDWALIQLDKARYPTAACGRLMNQVDLRTSDSQYPTKLRRLLNPKPANTVRFEYPESGLLRIHGMIPVAEMKSPKMLDKDDEESILVGKYGATTGLTWAAASEILSMVRHYLPDGGSLQSREWAVKGSLHDRSKLFSQAGDSGAAVFDIEGRFGGMLTRGAGISGAIDVTYVTPAEWLLADIERHLGVEMELL
ncbi:hypothetical protein SPBR_03459 [Sporothrix brasiliensis 5110]|uniref:Uncharacterized protein n=1 Tax=Sporothrix brasiliensis 5110 TaxID=1398154 RepID=A0A0C2F7N8_9PEZI|nr:uncharacterized protein SPBR_03459 [Sporothrix brasiliensis 5110]KIH95024.1 hypothetical protein SPBR_03459 [Sporothrix brasiliensis 5110]